MNDPFKLPSLEEALDKNRRDEEKSLSRREPKDFPTLKPPKLKRDWVGKLVRTKREMRNGVAAVKAGTLCEVTSGHNGASIQTIECPCCGISIYLTQVDWNSLDFLGNMPEDMIQG